MADEEQLLGEDDSFDQDALLNGQDDLDGNDLLNGENGEPKSAEVSFERMTRFFKKTVSPTVSSL